MRTFTIRCHRRHSGNTTTTFPCMNDAGVYYVDYTSFAAVPQFVTSQTDWVEVTLDVPDNGFNLGVHTDGTGDSLVETVSTGRRTVISGSNFELVHLAVQSYLSSLGNHMDQLSFRR